MNRIPALLSCCVFLVTARPVEGAQQFQTLRKQGARLLPPAVYIDSNRSGTVDAGDELVLDFDHAVVVNGARGTSIELPVAGDSLGSGAAVTAGPFPQRVLVTLGSGAALRVRGKFASGSVGPRSPSGVDVAATMPAGAIVTAVGGHPALSTGGVDLVPGFVAGPVLDTGPALGGRVFDMDCDGDLDVLTVDNGDSIKVWHNLGNGQLVHLGKTLGKKATQAFAVADVNDDGLKDVIDLGSRFTVWVNQGFGSFTQGYDQPLGTTIEALAARLDGDGRADVVRVSPSGARTHLNDGTGSFFSLGGVAGSGLSVSDAAVADFDRDSHLDFVVVSDVGGGGIYLNDGAANYGAQAASTGTAGALGVAADDVDADGWPDVVKVTDYGSVQVFLGGPGATLALHDEFSLGAPVSDVELVDVDGDGSVDALCSDAGAGVAIWLNRGDGSFFDSRIHLGNGPIRWLKTADLDGDGALDLVLGADQQPKQVWYGSRSSAWGDIDFHSSGQALGAWESGEMLLGDFNGDNHLDLVEAVLGAPNVLYWGAGNGLFTGTAPPFGGSLNTRGIAAGDVDRDGDLDLVTTDFEPQFPLLVWENDGAGNLSVVQSLPGLTGLAVYLRDMDDDGDLDLINVQGTGARLFFYDGGQGKFVYTGVDIAHPNTNHGDVGDLDCDGDLDLVLVAASGSGASAKAFFNVGNGFLLPGTQAIGNTDAQYGTLADLDGDADLDLIKGNSNSGGAVEFWFNDGSGVFMAGLQTLQLSFTARVRPADLDLDGDQDLVIPIHFAAGANLVYFNDGFGSFVDSGLKLGNERTATIAIGDLDEDGSPDIVEGNSAPGQGRVWIND